MNPALDSNMDAIRAKLLKALDEKRNSLHEHEIYEILGLAGFRVPRTRFVANEKEIAARNTAESAGGEVVCKLISPGMPHRTEFGGIKFIANDPKEIAAAFREFAGIAAKARVPFAGMMIAEKIPGRDSIPFQLLVSIRQDPSFGPVVFCGLGGLGTEVYKKSLTREKGSSSERPRKSGIAKEPNGPSTPRSSIPSSRARPASRESRSSIRPSSAPRSPRSRSWAKPSPPSTRIRPSRSRRSRSIRSRSRTTGSSFRSMR